MAEDTGAIAVTTSYLGHWQLVTRVVNNGKPLYKQHTRPLIVQSFLGQAVAVLERLDQGLSPGTSSTTPNRVPAGHVPRQIDAQGRPVPTARPISVSTPSVDADNPRDCVKCGDSLPEGWRFLSCSGCLFGKT